MASKLSGVNKKMRNIINCKMLPFMLCKFPKYNEVQCLKYVLWGLLKLTEDGEIYGVCFPVKSKGL
jgi:hypothetical protein